MLFGEKIRAALSKRGRGLAGRIAKARSYKRRGQIRNWSDAEEAIDGDFLSLKELDVRRADVLDTLIKAYKYWIAVADIDGFRVDTVKHMESSATAIFCNAIREYARRIGKHNFFIFGEIVADDETLQRYLGRNSRIAGPKNRLPRLMRAGFRCSVFGETIKGLLRRRVARALRRFKTNTGTTRSRAILGYPSSIP